jgi:hypothetical protein
MGTGQESPIFTVDIIIKKGKVVPRHEDICGSGGIVPPFSTSTPEGGEWSASGPGRFTPGVRAAGNRWIGGWVGPTICLDAVE